MVVRSTICRTKKKRKRRISAETFDWDFSALSLFSDWNRVPLCRCSLPTDCFQILYDLSFPDGHIKQCVASPFRGADVAWPEGRQKVSKRCCSISHQLVEWPAVTTLQRIRGCQSVSLVYEGFDKSKAKLPMCLKHTHTHTYDSLSAKCQLPSTPSDEDV